MNTSSSSSNMTATDFVRVYVSGIIPNAQIEHVWKLVGSFNGLPSWYDVVVTSEMEDSATDNSVGGVRILTLNNGVVQREQLIALSNVHHYYTYTVLHGIPWEDDKKDYKATISLKRITTAGVLNHQTDNSSKQDYGTFLEWTAEFSCPHGEYQKWHDIIASIFEHGIHCLQRKFSSTNSSSSSQ